jgi:hypothetical protein
MSAYILAGYRAAGSTTESAIVSRFRRTDGPMATDHIRYDLLVQDALRRVVRTVIEDAKNGLPGEHHFYITFDTTAEGVRLSPRMRAQYPKDMTIVLQHQFWDLTVTEETFEVGLAFGGISERLCVPFAAIQRFVDPSVPFEVRFEAVDAEQGEAAPASPEVARPPAELSGPRPTPAAQAHPEPPPDPDKPKGSGEVVRLDRFRKK